MVSHAEEAGVVVRKLPWWMLYIGVSLADIVFMYVVIVGLIVALFKLGLGG